MTCHSQIFTDTPMLRPVVVSAQTNKPLTWARVNNLPNHVYFDHSVHIAKGVGCTTCHGQVGDMALTEKGEPLSMRWCIDCHRDPASRLRPAAEIFAARWIAPVNQRERGAAIFKANHIETEHLTNCSSCHH